MLIFPIFSRFILIKTIYFCLFFTSIFNFVSCRESIFYNQNEDTWVDPNEMFDSEDFTKKIIVHEHNKDNVQDLVFKTNIKDITEFSDISKGNENIATLSKINKYVTPQIKSKSITEIYIRRYLNMIINKIPLEESNFEIGISLNLFLSIDVIHNLKQIKSGDSLKIDALDNALQKILNSIQLSNEKAVYNFNIFDIFSFNKSYISLLIALLIFTWQLKSASSYKVLITIWATIIFIFLFASSYMNNYNLLILEKHSERRARLEMNQGNNPCSKSSWSIINYLFNYDAECIRAHKDMRILPKEEIDALTVLLYTISNPFINWSKNSGLMIESFLSPFPFYMKISLMIVFVTLFIILMFLRYSYKIKMPFLSIEPTSEPAQQHSNTPKLQQPGNISGSNMPIMNDQFPQLPPYCNTVIQNFYGLTEPKKIFSNDLEYLNHVEHLTNDSFSEIQGKKKYISNSSTSIDTVPKILKEVCLKDEQTPLKLISISRDPTAQIPQACAISKNDENKTNMNEVTADVSTPNLCEKPRDFKINENLRQSFDKLSINDSEKIEQELRTTSISSKEEIPSRNYVTLEPIKILQEKITLLDYIVPLNEDEPDICALESLEKEK